MDYVDFPRKLVYRERRSLEDFVEEHEENALFIDNMLDNYYFSSASGKERALSCFNNAYYLCTMILHCKSHPEWNFAKYCDIARKGENKFSSVFEAFTLSLVYIFLTQSHQEVMCEKLMKKLNNHLQNILNALARDPILGHNYYYSDACNDLLNDVPDDLLIAEEFIPRKIDRDIFRDVDGPGDQWSRMTNYYDGQEIRKIVDFLGKNEEEKHILIELIDHDAQRFYGSNGAPYIQNVKPMLEEMDECIYHEYNGTDNPAIAEGEKDMGDNQLVELYNLADAQKTIEEQAQTIDELRAEIARLKEAKDSTKSDEQYNIEINRLKGVHEDTLVKLLKPAFFNIEDDARDFLKRIQGLDNQGVTDVARQFLHDRKITPSKKGRFIWNILTAAKLYTCVEQNWTAALRKDD